MEDFTPAKARQMIGRGDALILEIGSSDGQDTMRFLSAFERPTLHCFECDPRAIAKWRRRVALHGAEKATLHETALSDSNGRRVFHQSGGTPPGPEWVGTGEWDMSGSLLAPDRHSEYVTWLTFPTTVEVDCVRLDDWADLWLPQDADWRIDLVWIDAQGAEAMVLRGGQRTLERTDRVYAECHPLPYYHGQATLADLDACLPGFERFGEWSQHNYLWRKQ